MILSLNTKFSICQLKLKADYQKLVVFTCEVIICAFILVAFVLQYPSPHLPRKPGSGNSYTLASIFQAPSDSSFISVIFDVVGS